ncbi:unnamed protein product [Moneuplotes crassus]|uniref:RING-type E3 ubiquitin transferase n=1 Tax=Euplotes crassus TaxID=5936 RepID=A0AAD2CY23_EUPCR|nr:unnamed protein product [Moneuplotes crassus]
MAEHYDKAYFIIIIYLCLVLGYLSVLATCIAGSVSNLLSLAYVTYLLVTIYFHLLFIGHFESGRLDRRDIDLCCCKGRMKRRFLKCMCCFSIWPKNECIRKIALPIATSTNCFLGLLRVLSVVLVLAMLGLGFLIGFYNPVQIAFFGSMIFSHLVMASAFGKQSENALRNTCCAPCRLMCKKTDDDSDEEEWSDKTKLRIQRIRIDILKQVKADQENQRVYGDNEEQKNIISDEDIQRYEAALQRELARLRARTGDEELNIQNFEVLQKFEEDKNIDSLIQKWETKVHQKNNDFPKSCGICLDTFKPHQSIIPLSCHQSHIFHHSCFKKWCGIQKTCPLCRANLAALISQAGYSLPAEP